MDNSKVVSSFLYQVVNDYLFKGVFFQFECSFFLILDCPIIDGPNLDYSYELNVWWITLRTIICQSVCFNLNLLFPILECVLKWILKNWIMATSLAVVWTKLCERLLFKGFLSKKTNVNGCFFSITELS